MCVFATRSSVFFFDPIYSSHRVSSLPFICSHLVKRPRASGFSPSGLLLHFASAPSVFGLLVFSSSADAHAAPAGVLWRRLLVLRALAPVLPPPKLKRHLVGTAFDNGQVPSGSATFGSAPSACRLFRRLPERFAGSGRRRLCLCTAAAPVRASIERPSVSPPRTTSPSVFRRFRLCAAALWASDALRFPLPLLARMPSGCRRQRCALKPAVCATALSSEFLVLAIAV